MHAIRSALLRQEGEGLKGTLEPDVVLHAGDPLRGVNFTQRPDWRTYPAGHRYAGESQGDIYKEAFGDIVHLIGPRSEFVW
ncbi:hypothetical protein MEBOL_002819 [Melittangium boletus DSM 14713]|uniref:Uncharacterized protein n=1 Tax=Melittangium boletus DSM 14713 TaxID=1294270 RepID=A0A250IDT2_9BACT|nr:hypothetical protein MEBOL_002819 [Melittangium boletus DSM 14713]